MGIRHPLGALAETVETGVRFLHDQESGHEATREEEEERPQIVRRRSEMQVRRSLSICHTPRRLCPCPGPVLSRRVSPSVLPLSHFPMETLFFAVPPLNFRARANASPVQFLSCASSRPPCEPFPAAARPLLS
eukprot:scaffold2677_cov220-Pinguiococcus_pyrenoidosus.AAC.8